MPNRTYTLYSDGGPYIVGSTTILEKWEGSSGKSVSNISRIDNSYTNIISNTFYGTDYYAHNMLHGEDICIIECGNEQFVLISSEQTSAEIYQFSPSTFGISRTFAPDDLDVSEFFSKIDFSKLEYLNKRVKFPNNLTVFDSAHAYNYVKTKCSFNINGGNYDIYLFKMKDGELDLEMDIYIFSKI